ncbi:MAG: DnaJ domain-containing protein [Solirubrobacterales bacterium]
MASDVDLYEVLGVSRNADSADIRAAYLVAAKRHHPDSGGDEADVEQMRLVNLAYEVLGNSTLRSSYDGGSRTNGLTIDELGKLFDLNEFEASFTALPRYKLAALNREFVRLESEGWVVERRHDHLICTMKPRFRWRRSPKNRERRMTVSIDADGLAHRNMQ